MDEAEAERWLGANVPRETIDLLERFVGLLRDEAQHQNLVAVATLPALWARHIVDSAQLVRLVDGRAAAGGWLDIGTGAGFPGLVVATVSSWPVRMIEPRAKRADFLARAAALLGVGPRASVIQRRVEVVTGEPAAIISARAVASLPKLFRSASHLADPATTWILPRGRNVALELAELARDWHGDFSIVPSVTDPTAGIVVARDVRARRRV